MDTAMRGLVREILLQTAKNGLMGAHHFFITFDTRAPGVQISEDLAARYPVEMTIVLQNKYWGLKVEEAQFEVSLSFNKVPEHLVVPFTAVLRFVDPSQEFGFKLEAIAHAPVAGLTSFKPLSAPQRAEPQRPEAPPTPPATPASHAEEAPVPGPTVVSLDSFRKK